MAGNVFGDPITDSTIRKEYERTSELVVPRIVKASVAYLCAKRNGRKTKARNYVEKVAKDCGSPIATLCIIYNATGDTLTYVDSRNWYNSSLVGSQHPRTIANGQWGGFVQIKSAGASTGSHGAVVYRGKNQSGHECDWMVSWENPYKVQTHQNMVYTEIREKDHFNGHVWDQVWDSMEKSKAYKKEDTWKGCMSFASTTSGNIAIMKAAFTLALAADMN